MTAINEIAPVGMPAVPNASLRYSSSGEAPPGNNGQSAFRRPRYGKPDEDASQNVDVPFSPATGTPNACSGFAAAMAGFSQILRGGTYLGNGSHKQEIALAEANQDKDPFGYRREANEPMRPAADIAAIEQDAE